MISATYLLPLMVMALLPACSDSGRDIDAAAVVRQVSSSVKQNQLRIGAAIAVKTRFLTDVAIHRKVIIELTLVAEPYQELLVEISPSDAFAVAGNFEKIIQADSEGLARKQIRLIPTIAGKHYFNATVSSLNGEALGAITVALPVADERGHVPEKAKNAKPRIELESLPVTPQ